MLTVYLVANILCRIFVETYSFLGETLKQSRGLLIRSIFYTDTKADLSSTFPFFTLFLIWVSGMRDHLKIKSAKYVLDSINTKLFMRNCLIFMQGRIWIHKINVDIFLSLINQFLSKYISRFRFMLQQVAHVMMYYIYTCSPDWCGNLLIGSTCIGADR